MRVLPVSFALAVLLSACSGDDEASSGSGAGSTGGSGGQGADGGGASGGSTSSGGNSSSGGGGSGSEIELGRISVQQFVTGAAMNESHAVGAFFFTSLAASSDCTSETLGTCVVSVCGAGSGGGLPPQVSAGDVTVTSSTDSTTLTWDGSGYPSSVTDGHFFTPGDTVEAVVAGTADFPGFEASVIAPGTVVVDSASFPPIIAQSQPYTMTWTATGTGELVFGLATTRSVGGERVERASFQCRVDISDETLTVPLEVVSQLLPTGATNCPGATCDETTAQATLALSAHTSVDLGDVSARLSTSSPPAHSSGALAPTSWTVEP